MMSSQLDNISMSIGALKAEVIGLRRDLQASEQRAVDSNSRADKHRAAIHRRVDDLVEEVSDIKINVETMKADVKDSKTVTDEVKQWKQRDVGALFMAGIAGTALGVVVVAFIAYWWGGNHAGAALSLISYTSFPVSPSGV
ncbi:DUF1515 domain-containing protein [Mesorhizobium sp. B292B1B]|uniref:DUF1515 family protein n=1 Tax=unclassified Mesorhizobium TaxID=325217 RepID=UPI0015E41570|nr:MULTISPECIES: DUF1515 family protein [unclassified Mesorhizobium]MCA0012916.1 DUF1515 domain-containing protein [Mesorhizobium sp. B294B1A1]MCA0037583.1 DUF1515 domain-containing protein [Mesorhizobium sp. B292B1B]